MRLVIIILALTLTACDSDGTTTNTLDTTPATTPDTATSSDADTTTIDGIACVEGTPEGYPCKADSDCARPLLCSITRKECSSPYTCVNDESCSNDPGRICVDHFCALRECTEDSDCLAVCRTTCNEGACE